jgi:hypothetical protein
MFGFPCNVRKYFFPPDYNKTEQKAQDSLQAQAHVVQHEPAVNKYKKSD